MQNGRRRAIPRSRFLVVEISRQPLNTVRIAALGQRIDSRQTHVLAAVGQRSLQQSIFGYLIGIVSVPQ